jgi:DNA-binding PadR family transcriptional regulator
MYTNWELPFLKKGVNSMDKRYMALGTSMLVLKLLKHQSMYGYQIIRELEQQSQNVFQLQEGTLYPILHTLEQQGAVTSYQQTADNGRLRKYYAITTHGQKMLDDKLKEWEVYQTAINQVIGGVLFE